MSHHTDCFPSLFFCLESDSNILWILSDNRRKGTSQVWQSLPRDVRFCCVSGFKILWIFPENWSMRNVSGFQKSFRLSNEILPALPQGLFGAFTKRVSG